MKKLSKREAIKDRAEKLISNAMEKISAEFEQELQSTLDNWGMRYPRHTFKAFQGHGMLSVSVYPAICGTNDITYCLVNRGAIGKLIGEVDSLVDWHCSLEWKVSTHETSIMESRKVR